MAHLGTFSATAMSEATAVNRGWDVVGGSGGHALVVHNGTMTDLGTLGSTRTAVYAINDNGQIVASGSNAQGQEHAFLLTQLVSALRIYRPPA
jgi:probable HAF family extracellular repeat protein